MFYIGIDVAKYKHDCCITDDSGDHVKRIFTITNNQEGFLSLKREIAASTSNLSRVVIGLEATGHYHQNLQAYLNKQGYKVVVFNPQQTVKYHHFVNNRATKTDKLDAEYIAELLKIDSLQKPSIPISYHREELLSLTRYRMEQVALCGELKMALKNNLDVLFPEVEKFFAKLYSNTVYILLEEYPSAEDIANCNLTHLINLLKKASHGHFTKEKATALRDLAKKSIGTSNASKKLILQKNIAHIRFLEEEIAQIEAKIEGLVAQISMPIVSIPGISPIIAASIWAELGGFDNFQNPDQIVAFAGLAPKIRQSGHSVHYNGAIERRGSKYLRHTLYTATKCVYLNEPVFQAYFYKKWKKEHKHYNSAMISTANKLIRVMFYLTKTDQTYNASALR